MNFHIIKSIAKGSIAEELEIEPGDKLISIDGNEIKDVLDYRYYINAEAFTMVIEKYRCQGFLPYFECQDYFRKWGNPYHESVERSND